MIGLYFAAFFAAISRSIAQIFYVLSAALLIYAYRKNINKELFRAPLLPFILIVFLVLILTSALGDNPALSFRVLKRMFWFLNFYLGYCLIANSKSLFNRKIPAPPKDRFITFALSIALGGALSVGWGLFKMLRFHQDAMTGGVSFSVRYGNILALILIVTSSCLFLNLYKNRKELLLFAISGVICFFGLIASTTRMSMLALMIALSLLFIYRFKLKGLFLSAAVALSMLVVIVLALNFLELHPRIYEKAKEVYNFTDPRTSIGWRFILWQESFKVFCDNPLLGVGIDNLHPYLKALPYQYMSNAHAHNDLLQILAEHGIVGFLAISALMLRLFSLHLKSALKGSPYGVIGVLLIITLSLEGITEYGFFANHVYMFFWALNGALVRLGETETTLRS